MKTKRYLARSAITITLAVIVAAPIGAQAGPNKVLNPGFETTVLPGPVKDAFLQNGLKNGIYPPGWRFEGATLLFDQTGTDPHSGTFAGAISGSFSGPRRECSVQCVDVPGGTQRDQVNGTASLAPAYVTDVPFAVTPNTDYLFSFWIRATILRDDTGAVTKIRWYDANHVPLTPSNGPSLIGNNDEATYLNFVNGNSGPFNANSPSWTPKSATVRSPSAARFAAVYLGYTDDAWIGQVVYDDVFFG